ncbi:MAG: hypothetical protein IKJ01_03225 [Lachnospiraceae bacterium]|nr:hypothetical protein [Lachnospiraceae bacterium]
MLENEYKKAYEHIKACEDSMEKILQQAEQKKKNKVSLSKQVVKPAILVAICVIALLVGIRIPTKNGMSILATEKEETYFDFYENGLLDKEDYEYFSQYHRDFVPVKGENVSVSRSGIIMTVEAVCVKENIVAAIISFSDEEGYDYINKKLEHVQAKYLFGEDGHELDHNFHKWEYFNYNEQTDKAYAMFITGNLRENIITDEKLIMYASYLTYDRDYEVKLVEMAQVEKNPITKVVDIYAVGSSPETDELLNSWTKGEEKNRTAEVLDMMPRDASMTDKLTLTGLAYEDGILKVQYCKGTGYWDTSCRDIWMNKKETGEWKGYNFACEECGVYWEEEVDGVMLDFAEKWFLVTEEDILQNEVYLAYDANEGFWQDEWRVEIPLKQ